MVWCGDVWYGVAWYGVAWRGVGWGGAVMCGVAWCGVVWCCVGSLHMFMGERVRDAGVREYGSAVFRACVYVSSSECMFVSVSWYVGAWFE